MKMKKKLYDVYEYYMKSVYNNRCVKILLAKDAAEVETDLAIDKRSNVILTVSLQAINVSKEIEHLGNTFNANLSSGEMDMRKVSLLLRTAVKLVEELGLCKNSDKREDYEDAFDKLKQEYKSEEDLKTIIPQSHDYLNNAIGSINKQAVDLAELIFGAVINNPDKLRESIITDGNYTIENTLEVDFERIPAWVGDVIDKKTPIYTKAIELLASKGYTVSFGKPKLINYLVNYPVTITYQP